MSMTTPLWNLPTDHAVLAEHVALAGKQTVDVGAGAGGLVRFLREQGADPIGVECGPAMIAQALEADPEHQDAYVDGVGQDLPLDDASADLVVFSYSLHHVPHEHRAAALCEAERVLRSGGTLAVLEPIAEGSGHETHKLVDDETAVRAAAQAALDDDMPATMTEREAVRYTTSYSYGDVAELEKDMVDIDSERQAAFDAVKDDVVELFHANAVEHDGAYWFAQPVIMRLFTKV